MCLTSMINEKWSPLQREVVDELIQQHALRTCQGRACARGCTHGCRDCCCSCMVTSICSRLTPVVFILSLIAVIMIGVMFVGPHFSSAKYKATQCHVVGVEDDEVKGCSCGRYCRSTTICVKVNVEYVKDDEEKVQGLLHITEGNGKCTVAPCSRSHADNEQDVAHFVQDYTPPHSFKCLYDPAEGSTKVIKHREITEDTPVIHMLVWPLVMLVLAIAAAIFICHTCGCYYACSDNPPKNIRITAANLHMQGIYTLKSLPVEERRRLVRECSPEPDEEEEQVQPQLIQRGEIPQPV